MRQCDYCGNSNKILFVAELFGFNSGVHLCEVCRSCFWNEEKGVDSEILATGVASLVPPVVPAGFMMASMMQKLIPRLLD